MELLFYMLSQKSTRQMTVMKRASASGSSFSYKAAVEGRLCIQ